MKMYYKIKRKTGKDRVKTGKIQLPVRLYSSNGVHFTYLGQEDRVYILIMSYLKERGWLLLCNLFSYEFASNHVLAVHMLTTQYPQWFQRSLIPVQPCPKLSINNIGVNQW